MIGILCPTRGRWSNVARLIKSIEDTVSTDYIELWLYVDHDDPGFIDQKFPSWVWKVIGKQEKLAECWNVLQRHAKNNCDVFMLCGDDIVFRTNGWNEIVLDAFDKIPDKIAYLHGDDGIQGPRFGTHGFLHKNWVDVIGYFVPPYFTYEYVDTWINDVSLMLNRNYRIPILTEHMHYSAGKSEFDKTYQDNKARNDRDNNSALYASLENKRVEDADKLKGVMY